MKKTKTIHILYLFFLFLLIILLAGCSKDSKTTEKKKDTGVDNEAEVSESLPSVSEGYLHHHPENMRMISDGTDIFICGDRGIYTINENGWNLIYQGMNIRGLELYKDSLYFLQMDSQNVMNLNRIGRDGSGMETLRADNSMSHELRIYDDVLYYYSNDMLMKGISLDENGNLQEDSDISSGDYPFKNWNEVTEGKTQSAGEALNPGYSMQYYNGIFEYKAKDELYRELYFTRDGESQLLISELSETALIAGNKIYYYLTGEENNGFYCYDMVFQDTALFEINSEVPVNFLNYDEQYVYYTGALLNASTFESPVYQLDTKQGTTQELPVTMGANNSSDCFDICKDCLLYRDNANGSLVLLNMGRLNHPIPEP